MTRVPVVLILVLALAVSCEGNAPNSGDLGSFLPRDFLAVDTGPSSAELKSGETLCFTGHEGELDLSVAGQMFEMSFKNLFPGEYIGDVHVKVRDLCGNQVHDFDVASIGSYAFHLPVDEGFNAYFEFPYKPEWLADEDYPFADYPLYREFDKPFKGDYIHCNLRLFAPDIISIPLSVLKQKDHLGYVQGTLYEWITYDTIADAIITPSSGKTTYISDTAHLPDGALTATQTKGLFLVANVQPGELTLTVELPSGNTVEKTVIVWPLTSEPNKVITNVGVPILPDLL